MARESITLSKLSTEIATHLNKELDEPFKRILADKVDAWRSRLLRNSLQDKPLESKFFRQTIYVPLKEAAPLPDCLTAPVCPVLQSTHELPQPLRYSTQLFDYVGSVDGNIAFKEVSPGTSSYLAAGKYSKHTVLWEWKGKRIEVLNRKNLPMVRVDGVFDKPSEAMRFNCEVAGTGCDYWDAPYPLTGDIAQMIVQSILQVDFARPGIPATKEVDLNPQKRENEPDGR